MRRAPIVVLLLCLALASSASAMTLERVVLVQRHGVRPPTSTNAELGVFSAAPWPAWPVAPGELTPHGALTVKLMGESLRAVYRASGVLPVAGCPKAGEVVVWADGTDERTRHSGAVLAEALAPGCGVKAAWGEAHPRDPIFGEAPSGACSIDADRARDEMAEAGRLVDKSRETRDALARLQAIIAPDACRGGPGLCLTSPPKETTAKSAWGPAPSLAEDLLLEYAEGMPAADVGWGRAASAATIAEVMPLHELHTASLRHQPYFAARAGAVMGRLVIAALAGESGPHSGPDVRVLALAGHDTNILLMAGLFGLDWTLPGEPDASAPATTLAFELWSDKGRRFVRPVIYYETSDQLRTLRPGRAEKLALHFTGCDGGPLGSCPLDALRARAEAFIPPGCGKA